MPAEVQLTPAQLEEKLSALLDVELPNRNEIYRRVRNLMQYQAARWYMVYADELEIDVENGYTASHPDGESFEEWIINFHQSLTDMEA